MNLRREISCRPQLARWPVIRPRRPASHDLTESLAAHTRPTGRIRGLQGRPFRSRNAALTCGNAVVPPARIELATRGLGTLSGEFHPVPAGAGKCRSVPP
jgi:hypothetical protein